MIQCNIFNETDYSPVPRKNMKAIVNSILSDNRIEEALVNIILMNNKELKELNIKYLNHNYNTDVISFALEEDPLEGEIYISVEEAAKNSKLYGASLRNELLRLVSHGALHLVGYDDDNEEKRKEMHKMENIYLASK